MAEIQAAPTAADLSGREQNDISMKNANESIDSGIEMSNEEKEKCETSPAPHCPWILGQLAWARGSSYPFWPCVVTLDPKTMQYYRLQSKGRTQSIMVHVQYFGDGGRHNWVLSHYMIPFVGLEEFEKRAKSIMPEAKKKNDKFTAAFFPKLGVKKQWGIGVTEATGLMHLSNEERASIFEPVPSPPIQTPPSSNKLKRKSSSKKSKTPKEETPTSGRKRFKKAENEELEEKLISISKQDLTASNLEVQLPTSEPISETAGEFTFDETSLSSRRKSMRNQNKNTKDTIDVPKRQNSRKKVVKLSEEDRQRREDIDFEDYYNLNKSFWKADHPDATDEEIRKFLKEIWNEMDMEQKANNLNRKYDEYRYSLSIDQSEVNDLSKNKENSVQGSNNIVSNGKNLEDPPKLDSESEKSGEIIRANVTIHKEKTKESSQTTNNNSLKEKNDTVPELRSDSNEERKIECTKIEDPSQESEKENSEKEENASDKTAIRESGILEIRNIEQTEKSEENSRVEAENIINNLEEML